MVQWLWVIFFYYQIMVWSIWVGLWFFHPFYWIWGLIGHHLHAKPCRLIWLVVCHFVCENTEYNENFQSLIVSKIVSGIEFWRRRRRRWSGNYCRSLFHIFVILHSFCFSILIVLKLGCNFYSYGLYWILIQVFLAISCSNIEANLDILEVLIKFFNLIV